MRATILFLGVLGVLIVPACGGDEAGGGGGIPDEAAMRGLLAEATSCVPQLVGVCRGLGGKLQLRDMEAAEGGAGPALLYLADQALLDPRDLKALSEGYADAITAMLPTGYREAGYAEMKRIPQGTLASLLRDEYVASVTIEPEGDGVIGEVAFEAPGAFWGRLRYTAAHDGERWRVTELSLPHSMVRVDLTGEKWKLHLPEVLRGVNPVRGMGVVTLPRVLRVGRDPGGSARAKPQVITVRHDGRIRFPGVTGDLSILDLRDGLRLKTADPRLRLPDGSSSVEVLLDIDTSVPWIVTQWILQVCADPTVRIYRIFFGAQAESGQHGSLAFFLPRDRGIRPMGEEVEPVVSVLKLLGSRKSGTSNQALWDALEAVPKDEWQERRIEIHAPSPHGASTPHGTVLRVLDLARLAGVRMIGLKAARLDVGEDVLRDPDELTALVHELRDRNVLPRLEFDGKLLDDRSVGPHALPSSGYVDDTIGFRLPKGYGEMPAEEAPGGLRIRALADDDLEEDEEEVEEIDTDER